jgi:phage tail-like protein
VLSAPGTGHFPPSASARALLRRGLPAIYQESPDRFAMRFLEALERVLDPRVAVIDCRAAYLDRALAPENMVEEMARWLGLEPEELPAGRARAVLTHARKLRELRGTLEGLELALTCCFPRLHFRLEDGGGVGPEGWPDHVSDRPDAGAGLLVRVREILDRAQEAALERIIRRQLPVHVELVVRHGDLSVPMNERP